ncbi:MAG: hypothetical protein RMM29_02995 [Planctomycetota bacterium]|nr:hypothetical protein [Planctomycetota bacterium]MCX8040028.1 hypothetical protein [Planctomycetota bacterium]MDW8372600.1 hypothetical protein [Planctomycetota bacterium]
MRCAVALVLCLHLPALESAPWSTPSPDIGGLFAAVEASVLAERTQRQRAQALPAGRWLTVRATAYSPHDEIDGAYHVRKGARWRWITADGRTDVRRRPYGIAVPRLAGGRPAWPFGTRVYIPLGQGYVDRVRPHDRVFIVDDCGSAIRERTEQTGVLHIDLRFQHEDSARAFAGAQGWRTLAVCLLDD